MHGWCKDWIQTKGSNRITHEYQVVDGKIDKFTIKQVPCKYADNIQRAQSFNIGLYDKEGKLVEKLENVSLEKKEVTEIAAMNGKAAPDAILLNSDDWGFGHFILDEATITVFEQSLGKVEANIDRAVIIGQIAAMIKQVEFPATRLPQVLTNLMEEQNQNLINALVGSLLQCQLGYIEPSAVEKFNHETFEFFSKKAQKSEGSLKTFCIEKAISFLHSKAHLELTSEWILKPQDTLSLTPAQKYAVLKMYCASSEFTKEQKEALKESVLKDDNTDEAKIVAKACELILPEAELKEKLWAEIIDPETKEPQKDLMQKMVCFM